MDRTRGDRHRRVIEAVQSKQKSHRYATWAALRDRSPADMMRKSFTCICQATEWSEFPVRSSDFSSEVGYLPIANTSFRLFLAEMSS